MLNRLLQIFFPAHWQHADAIGYHTFSGLNMNMNTHWPWPWHGTGRWDYGMKNHVLWNVQSNSESRGVCALCSEGEHLRTLQQRLSGLDGAKITELSAMQNEADYPGRNSMELWRGRGGALPRLSAGWQTLNMGVFYMQILPPVKLTWDWWIPSHMTWLQLCVILLHGKAEVKQRS